MRTKLASLLAGLALLGLAGTAQAAAPSQVVKLSDAQLDEVTAGYWQPVGVWSIAVWYSGRFWYFYNVPLWLWR